MSNANEGLEMVEFAVVRFFDDNTSARWFNRDHTEIGCVTSLADGGVPCNKAEVLRVAHEAFGADCAVLWP